MTRLRCGGLRVWEKRGSGARAWRARLPGDDRLEEVLTQKVVGREGTPRGQAFGIPGVGAKSRGRVDGVAARLMDRPGRRLLRSERGRECLTTPSAQVLMSKMLPGACNRGMCVLPVPPPRRVG